MARTEAPSEIEAPDELEPVFLNRELSRLDFYERVLALAADEQQPLLERINFLAFFGGFLDEFFQIRVSGLKEQAAAGLTTTSPDGLSPREQLDAIRARVQELSVRAGRIFETLGERLAAQCSSLSSYDHIGTIARQAKIAGDFPHTPVVEHSSLE